MYSYSGTISNVDVLPAAEEIALACSTFTIHTMNISIDETKDVVGQPPPVLLQRLAIRKLPQSFTLLQSTQASLPTSLTMHGI